MGEANGEEPREEPEPKPKPKPTLRPSGVHSLSGVHWVKPLSEEPSAQRRVDRILSEADTLPGRIAELVIASLIIGASVLYVLQRTGWVSPDAQEILGAVETGITVVFLIEYLVRFWAKEYSIRYLLTPLALIDLIAILPLFTGGIESLLVIRTLRILRLLRLLRMLQSRQFFFGEIAQEHLLVVRILFTVFCLFFITGGMLYEVERGQPGQNGFQTIFESFYFAVVTLTTVGFGDVTPVTKIGKSITMIAIMLGILIIPWQLANLAKYMLSSHKAVDFTCGTCGLHGHDADASHCKACGTVIYQEYEGEVDV
jgi:voltage-gated potassium channel